MDAQQHDDSPFVAATALDQSAWVLFDKQQSVQRTAPAIPDRQTSASLMTNSPSDLLQATPSSGLCNQNPFSFFEGLDNSLPDPIIPAAIPPTVSSNLPPPIPPRKSVAGGGAVINGGGVESSIFDKLIEPSSKDDSSSSLLQSTFTETTKFNDSKPNKPINSLNLFDFSTSPTTLNDDIFSGEVMMRPDTSTTTTAIAASTTPTPTSIAETVKSSTSSSKKRSKGGYEHLDQSDDDDCEDESANIVDVIITDVSPAKPLSRWARMENDDDEDDEEMNDHDDARLVSCNSSGGGGGEGSGDDEGGAGVDVVVVEGCPSSAVMIFDDLSIDDFDNNSDRLSADSCALTGYNRVDRGSQNNLVDFSESELDTAQPSSEEQHTRTVTNPFVVVGGSGSSPVPSVTSSSTNPFDSLRLGGFDSPPPQPHNKSSANIPILPPPPGSASSRRRHQRRVVTSSSSSSTALPLTDPPPPPPPAQTATSALADLIFDDSPPPAAVVDREDLGLSAAADDDFFDRFDATGGDGSATRKSDEATAAAFVDDIFDPLATIAADEPLPAAVEVAVLAATEESSNDDFLANLGADHKIEDVKTSKPDEDAAAVVSPPLPLSPPPAAAAAAAAPSTPVPDCWMMEMRFPQQKRVMSSRRWVPICVRINQQNKNCPSLNLYHNERSHNPFFAIYLGRNDWQMTQPKLQHGRNPKDLDGGAGKEGGGMLTVPGSGGGGQLKMVDELATAAVEKLNTKKLHSIKFLNVRFKEKYSFLTKRDQLLLKAPVGFRHAAHARQMVKLGTEKYSDLLSLISSVENAAFLANKLMTSEELKAESDSRQAEGLEDESQSTHIDDFPTNKYYSREEIIFDVKDEFRGSIKSDNRITDGCKVTVRVFVTSFLSGNTNVTVGFNDLQMRGREQVRRCDVIPSSNDEWIEVGQVMMHRCCRVPGYHLGLLTFAPLDACRFELMRFRALNDKPEIPLNIRPSIEFHKSRVKLRCVLLSNNSHLSNKDNLTQVPCEKLSIRFPLPSRLVPLFQRKTPLRTSHSFRSRRLANRNHHTAVNQPPSSSSSASAVLEASVGSAKYEHAYSSLVWQMDRFPEKNAVLNTPQVLTCTFDVGDFPPQHPSDDPTCPPWWKEFLECQVEYTMPSSTASRACIRSVAIGDDGGATQVERFTCYSSHYLYHLEIGVKSNDDDDSHPSCSLQ